MDKLEPIRRALRQAGLYNHAADDLLCQRLADAALDAARGQAVAWVPEEAVRSLQAEGNGVLTHLYPEGVSKLPRTPLFAAPPAALAVAASKGDAERSKAWRSVCDTLDRVCPDWMDANGKTGTELAVAAIERLAAQQPAALAVPEGWRVMWFTGTVTRDSERWEIYDPEGNGGAVDKGDVRDDMVRGLLDALAAARKGEP